MIEGVMGCRGIKMYRNEARIMHWEMRDNWERERNGDERIICVYNYFNFKWMKIYWTNLVTELSWVCQIVWSRFSLSLNFIRSWVGLIVPTETVRVRGLSSDEAYSYSQLLTCPPSTITAQSMGSLSISFSYHVNSYVSLLTFTI